MEQRGFLAQGNRCPHEEAPGKGVLPGRRRTGCPAGTAAGGQQREEARKPHFQVSGGARPLRHLGVGPLASRTARQYVSVVPRDPVCGALLGQLQETNAEGKGGIAERARGRETAEEGLEGETWSCCAAGRAGEGAAAAEAGGRPGGARGVRTRGLTQSLPRELHPPDDTFFQPQGTRGRLLRPGPGRRYTRYFKPLNLWQFVPAQPETNPAGVGTKAQAGGEVTRGRSVG